MRKVAFAVGPHPDDIEFRMAGTLLQLRRVGYELHYMNVSDGCCGGTRYGRRELARLRAEEGRQAARLLGAVFHPSVAHDLEVLYDIALLRWITAVMRRVNPTVLLVPSLSDYMEDHVNTARLAITAAFALPVTNFSSKPRAPAVAADCTIYHAIPVTNRDVLRRRLFPGQYVNVTPFVEQKRALLACHRSQQEWLDQSQGLNSYIDAMVEQDRELGRMSGMFEYAEGWTRHCYRGFSPVERNPLAGVLGDDAYVDPDYEAALERRP
jgi:LmbE family N-acetylglucosaminyl deacetylase